MANDRLQTKAFEAADLWATYDKELTQLDAFTKRPWEVSRDSLNTALTIADSRGADLTQFQGPDSPLSFPS